MSTNYFMELQWERMPFNLKVISSVNAATLCREMVHYHFIIFNLGTYLQDFLPLVLHEAPTKISWWSWRACKLPSIQVTNFSVFKDIAK